MSAVLVPLSRRELDLVRKAARGKGLTPSQFIAQASFECAKATLDRIDTPNSAVGSLTMLRPPARCCKQVARRHRRPIIHGANTFPDV